MFWDNWNRIKLAWFMALFLPVTPLKRLRISDPSPLSHPNQSVNPKEREWTRQYLRALGDPPHSIPRAIY
jgi:hypothetical protein